MYLLVQLIYDGQYVVQHNNFYWVHYNIFVAILLHMNKILETKKKTNFRHTFLLIQNFQPKVYLTHFKSWSVMKRIEMNKMNVQKAYSLLILLLYPFPEINWYYARWISDPSLGKEEGSCSCKHRYPAHSYNAHPLLWPSR